MKAMRFFHELYGYIVLGSMLVLLLSVGYTFIGITLDKYFVPFELEVISYIARILSSLILGIYYWNAARQGSRIVAILMFINTLLACGFLLRALGA